MEKLDPVSTPDEEESQSEPCYEPREQWKQF
jgi:hypothetical protein